MLDDVECNNQIESTASPCFAQARIGRKDVESCLDRSRLQHLACFTPYPVRTSAACPASKGAVAIADLANSQSGRLLNAGGLELALEVQRLFTVDLAKVSGAPILPHGVTVVDRRRGRDAIQTGTRQGLLRERDHSYSATAPGESRPRLVMPKGGLPDGEQCAVGFQERFAGERGCRISRARFCARLRPCFG